MDNLKVGQKVIHVDTDNMISAIGVISEDHGEGEYTLLLEDGGYISPISHDGEDQIIQPLCDAAYSLILDLHKHCEQTGFFKNED